MAQRLQRRPSRRQVLTADDSSPPPPLPIKITICGDGGCGKSAITIRLVRSQWTSDYDPTIEDSYSVTRRIDGATYHLALTDTAGQEEYRGMWANSNLKSDAFLLVYDITQRDSLSALQEFNELIDRECLDREELVENIAESRRGMVKAQRNALYTPGTAIREKAKREIIAQPVKLVVGNKCDLQARRQITAKAGLEWARSRNCGFMETSARNCVNIEESFELIVRRVVEARKQALLATGLWDGPGGGSGGGISPVRNTGNSKRNTQSSTESAREQRGYAKEEGSSSTNSTTLIGASADDMSLPSTRARTAPLAPLTASEKGDIDDGVKKKEGFWQGLKCW